MQENSLNMISIKLIRQGNNVLVAACDEDLLGKTLKYGKVNFEIRREFYGGKLVQVEDAIDLIKTATTVNLIGSVIVTRAIRENLVHPQAILDISGVPHAQIIKV